MAASAKYQVMFLGDDQRAILLAAVPYWPEFSLWWSASQSQADDRGGSAVSSIASSLSRGGDGRPPLGEGRLVGQERGRERGERCYLEHQVVVADRAYRI